MNNQTINKIYTKEGNVKEINDLDIPFLFGDAPGVSYPWLKGSRKVASRGYKVRAVKCSCGCVWCPKCFRRKGKVNVANRLKNFDWRKTRHVVLTIDREKFVDGESAFLEVNSRKLISNMLHNLRRTANIKMVDWLWCLEWHKDGFPHWHVFVERDVSGKSSMIGGELLRKYWPWGSYILEQYVHNENHWKALIGYFDKHGYFDDEKKFQSKLPPWAEVWERKIRRWGAMAYQRVDEDEKQFKTNFSDGGGREGRKMKNYGVILESCGKSTFIEVCGEFESWGFGVRRKVDVEYSSIRKDGLGQYVDRVGYVFDFDFKELKNFLNQREEMRSLLFEIQEKYLKDEFSIEWGGDSFDDN